MSEIKEVWFGKRNLSNVIVKLVQINHDSDIKTGDSHCKKAICACTRSKKRGLDLDSGRNITLLAIFHLHSNTLQSSKSKYFETCFSDRWIPNYSQRQPMELTLEAQSDVGHYEDCFANMYKWTSTKFGSVTHCVGMLKVALQLLYERVVEDGVCYLSTMQWSKLESEMVRELVVGSESFPLDSAKDVLARLGMTHRLVGDDKDDEGIHDIKVREMAEITLKRVFIDALKDDQDPMLTNMKKLLFTKTFKQLIARPSPNALTRFALDLVNSKLKSTIENLVQYVQDSMQNLRSPLGSENTLKRLDWLLNVSLKNNVAKYAVEFVINYNEDLVIVLQYIFNFSLLHPDMDSARSNLLQHFAATFCSIFVEVAQGRVFLTTDLRFTLIQRWSWLMLHRLDKNNAQWALAKMSIIELIGNLPLLDQTLIFENLHDDHNSQMILGEAYIIWCNRVMREYNPEMLDS